MSAMSPPRLDRAGGGVRLQGAGARAFPTSNTPISQLFDPIAGFGLLTPGGEGCCRLLTNSIVCSRTRSRWHQDVPYPGGGPIRIRGATSAEARGPRVGSPRPCDTRSGVPGPVRTRPLADRVERGAAVIDDRMRGPGNGTTTVWVYDERRRVRDDVASRLVALPFVGRVEVIGDAASLMSRLATRMPDVLIVGTQRAVDTGLTAATQALRAYPGLPVLVLGAPDDAESVRAAVAFGARGYLRWDASPIEMGLGLSRVGLRADGRVPQQAASMQNVGVPA